MENGGNESRKKPMRWWTVIFFLAVGVVTPVHGALQITSVGPDVVTPGDLVVVTGGPFSPEVEILVGEVLISPSAREDRRLSFSLPSLPAGQYLLRLVEGDRISLQAFTLRVVEPLPRLIGLTPDTIEACPAGAPPSIAVGGTGFLPGARLLLDGAAVPIDGVTDTQIVFTPPRLNPGLHQVVVANPGGGQSLPQTLQVDGRPEIDAVQQGADFVTSYEVLIHGRNFLGSSQLVVDGRLISLTSATPSPEGSAIYIDCGTIVYTRYPYSSEPKPVALQILNPGGLQSPVLQVAIP
jgi:hypothetical protein